jgi:hypothetical protein
LGFLGSRLITGAGPRWQFAYNVEEASVKNNLKNKNIKIKNKK